jgi:hypothetical protein
VVEEVGEDGETIEERKGSDEDNEGNAHITRRISQGVMSLRSERKIFFGTEGHVMGTTFWWRELGCARRQYLFSIKRIGR